jgi:hypothetical protein
VGVNEELAAQGGNPPDKGQHLGLLIDLDFLESSFIGIGPAEQCRTEGADGGKMPTVM